MKNSGSKRTDIRVQKTYERLFNAFFDMLSNKPYDSITVLEICEKAGVHRATFYKHFIDKQDFVSFCFDLKLEELNLINENDLFPDDDSSNSYIDMCRKMVDFFYENKQLILENDSKSTSLSFCDALENSISDFIEKKLSRATVASKASISPIPMLAHYYAGAVVGMLKWWTTDGTEYTKDDVMNFVLIRYNELTFSYKHIRNSI